MKNFATINENEPLEVAVHNLLNGQCKNFLVTDNNNQPVGTLSRDEIIEALTTKGNNVLVKSVMNKNIESFEAHQPIEKVYQIMAGSKTQLVTIYENKNFIGVLDFENILEYLMVKGALAKK
jgi:predicted transcriptional regulator